MIAWIARAVGIPPFAVTGVALLFAAASFFGYGKWQHHEGYKDGVAYVTLQVEKATKAERERQEQANEAAQAEQRKIINDLLDKNKSLEDRDRKNNEAADKDQHGNSGGVHVDGVRRIDSIR